MVVAKDALAQPISAWPCIWDLNLPPNATFQSFTFDAPSSVIHSLYGVYFTVVMT